ncbi:hypothetical protein Adt_38924 [Abeliophyllum distichum]|uniref:Uncharacterized protein n=1 Tax=Abeliophyllum distichum TaxID=126358 RepID=A0ABD1Q3M0_9LAMI
MSYSQRYYYKYQLSQDNGNIPDHLRWVVNLYGIYEDVIELLARQIEYFATQIKNDPSNVGRRKFSMVVSPQFYTVQQEVETIDAARKRAITPSWLHERLGDFLIY